MFLLNYFTNGSNFIIVYLYVPVHYPAHAQKVQRRRHLRHHESDPLLAKRGLTAVQVVPVVGGGK